jgi:hypothetical protein
VTGTPLRVEEIIAEISRLAGEDKRPVSRAAVVLESA